MTRTLAATLALLAALPAAAQVQAVRDRQAGLPAGVPLTVPGVAAAEEATALALNPAGIGFVGELQLAWQHESDLTPGSRGDALFVADTWGALGVGYAQQWIRPGEGGGDRWRKQTLGLSLGDGRAFSIGFGWNWFTSPGDALDAARSWDAGFTWRPARFLSLSASALDQDLRVDGVSQPIRYDVGLGVRVWNDALTLTADVLGDDAGEDVRATHAAVGLGLETGSGLGFSGQLQFPVRDDVPGSTMGVFAITWNAGFGGISGGAHPEGGWLGGARLSAERYRAPSPVREVPGLDLERELEQRFWVFVPVGERDRWGALLERLARLRDDPDVGGVVLRVGDLDLGAGRGEELRGLVAAIAAKKPVLAYLEGRDTRSYWVASAATAVAAAPGAAVFANGIGASSLYLKDGLARLGVVFEVVKVGAYKSASEPLTRTGSSPEAREATDALLDDLYGRLVADVSASRKLEPAKVRALFDRGLFVAEEARDAGLLDAVLWPDELEGWAKGRRMGGLVTLARYDPAPARQAQIWGNPDVVEVIRIEGAIAGGRSRDAFGSDGIAGAETVAREIGRAARDGSVKAIVLRIESPGGDGAAGDLIWRAVVRAREKKPVVASMGDVAASAGYLVAVGADEILAEPSTITGSIGVFAIKPDLSGLIEKLSVKREVRKRGENADLFSLAKPWSESERAALQRAVDAFYAAFVEKVAAGRKLPKADVEKVAGGRVWSGRAALERKLVDRLGGLEDAVAVARQRAGLDAGAHVEVRRWSGAGDVISGTALAAARAAGGESSTAERLVALLPEARALAVLAEMGPVLALPLEWVEPVTARP